jgi:predicted HicB family RNase H-like nuclease
VRTLKAKAPRVQMGMRVTPQMHELIVTAARESGRSITQEIEHRLEVANLALRWDRRPGKVA